MLENKNIEFDGEVNLVSENLVSVSQQESEKIIKLLELIEEHDDVQRVHTNFEIKS